MKCKVCGSTMVRQKASDHTFFYRCPKCGTTIKGQRDQRPMTEYQRAYQQAMEKADTQK